MEKKYRDGLFRNYFSDKRRLLGLCNLLTGEDATDPDEITINTLDGIFFGKLKNDISCLFRGKFLVIIEHQSTLNENMPLRILFYAAELFRQYADEYRDKIYREELLHLPEPKFFVFYNGRKKESARRTLRLSDAFGKRTCLEVIVEFYNLNAGMNDAFVAADESLNNYCTFLNLFEQLKADGLDPNHALAAAFKYCIAHGVMAEYLLTIKKELASMLALEYDPEAERQAWIDYGIERGIDIGREQGIERGIDIGREQVAKNLLAMNFSTSDIIAATGLTAEQIRKLADTNGGEHTLTNAILLDERDNVATCTSAAQKGDTIKILGGGEIVCVEDIPIWHKVALKPIVAGEKIFKYGEIIGEAASDIAAGAWVSHENIFSVPRDYQCEFLAEVHS